MLMMSRDYPADLYASLHNGNVGDEDFYRAVCVGADRVLELGCGSRRILAVLADQVTELHGVDSSDETLALARTNLPASVELQRGRSDRDGRRARKTLAGLRAE